MEWMTWIVRSVVVGVALSPVAVMASQSVAPDDPSWRFEGDEVSVQQHEGRTAIRIRSGLAFLDELRLQDGVIEFDVYVSGERSFVYLLFRGQTDQDYEDIYLRPHKTGLPDALQYAPVFQRRSAWQLYHGDAGTAAVVLPAHQWTTVKLSLSGQRATIWVGGGDEPAMIVEALGRVPAAGWIALRGFVPPGSPATYAAYFSNLQITPAQVVEQTVLAPEELPAGLIDSWQVSPAFDAAPGPVTAIPASVGQANWSTPAMQPNGVFEFLRSRPVPEGSRRWAVAAKATLRSARSQVCALHLGYSDEITLSLNDQLIFYQDSSYRFGNPRQDSVLHADQAVAYLHLNEGDNEVGAIVTDRFGGWGLTARLQHCEGVEVR